jgi:VanZ family protein
MNFDHWPQRLEKRALIWPLLIFSAVLVCSGQPTVQIDGAFGVDKVAHVAIFGALATSLVRCRWFRKRKFVGAISAIAMTSVLGLGDEFRQGWGGARIFDRYDWVADTCGALLAVSLYVNWSAYRRGLEMPLRRRKRRVAVNAA